MEVERHRLREILQNAPAMIAVLRGPAHVFVTTNARYDRLAGGRPLVGRTAREAWPELEGQGFFELLDEVYETGVPFVGDTVRFPQHGDTVEERWLNFVYQPYRDADGRVEGIFAHVVDVTDTVRARNEADAANRAKDEFLAMLGHELRNPLGPIVSALQLVTLRGDRSRELEIAGRQVGHLVRLVDDLLDVSRIASGKVELKRAVVTLDDVLSSALETVEPALDERHQPLRFDLERGLCVDGDRDRLAQVFANLIQNASKYSDPGRTVTVRVRADGEAAVIEVVDQGVGIDADLLPRVFDLFWQTPQEIDRAAGGLGLGLSIVRSLVVQHGGTVEARSAGRGQGSTFVVRLPLTVESRGGVLEPEPTQPGVSSIRVLVVDDNADAAELVALRFDMEGCVCRTAHDGPSALVALEQGEVDVAVLDIGLPGMSGYELAREIRRTRGEGIRLIALTGYGRETDRERAMAAGFDVHLVKPVDPERLLRVALDLPEDPG